MKFSGAATVMTILSLLSGMKFIILCDGILKSDMSIHMSVRNSMGRA